MSAVVGALLSSLLSSPAGSGSETVYRPPVTVTGEVAVTNRGALRRRVSEEFARTDFDSVLPVDPSACTTARCWHSEAQASGSRYTASLTVDALEADQRLSIAIVDLVDGDTVVELERTCELCGRDELLDATADLCATALRRLQSHAAVTTEILVDSVPSGAAVMLDGDEVGTTPLRVAVSPGPHTVELSAPGYDPFSETVDIDRGTTQSLRLQLSTSGLPGPPLDGPPSGGGPTRRRGRMIAGASLLGGGFAAAAAGVTLMVLHGRPVTSDCSGREVDSDGDCHFLHDTRTGGVIGLSAGAAALIGGAVILGLEFRRERPVTVTLSPTPAGLLVRGRF